LDWF